MLELDRNKATDPRVQAMRKGPGNEKKRGMQHPIYVLPIIEIHQKLATFPAAMVIYIIGSSQGHSTEDY